MRVFAIVVFLVGGALAAGPMPETDSELWKWTLPGKAFYYASERSASWTNSAIYRSFTTNCTALATTGPQRLPSRAWMAAMTEETLERFKVWRTKDQWTVSPYFKDVGRPPVTETAAENWNPHSWIQDYMSLDGGSLWPWQVGVSNTAARAVETAVAGLYESVGFSVGEGTVLAPWATSLTEQVVTNAAERESVARFVGSGRRILSPYVAPALDRLYEEGDYWVAYLAQHSAVPRYPVVTAKWKVTATAAFKIAKEKGKWSVEVVPEYTSEYSEETNMVDIVGDATVMCEGVYDGDQMAGLYGPVLVGFPADTSTSNLTKIGTSTVDNGVECWKVPCDDLLGVESVPSGKISSTYEASWILPIGSLTGRLAHAVGESRSFAHPYWGDRDFSFQYPAVTYRAYIPQRVYISYMDEYYESEFRDFFDVLDYSGTVGAVEWQDILGAGTLIARVPANMFTEKRHSPVVKVYDSSTGDGSGAAEIWDNVGVVHYYAKTEPPIHLGYRINGENYGVGEFAKDSNGDVLHTAMILGTWASTRDVVIERIPGECPWYSGIVEVASRIFVIYRFDR